MRQLALFAFGLACVAGLIGLGFYTTYLQWWVHPEYTKPQMFWAYWHLSAIAVGLSVGACVSFATALED